MLDVNAQNLIDAAKLQTAAARKAAAVRGYMLSGDPNIWNSRMKRGSFSFGPWNT